MILPGLIKRASGSVGVFCVVVSETPSTFAAKTVAGTKPELIYTVMSREYKKGKKREKQRKGKIE